MVVSPPTERRVLRLDLSGMGRLGEALAQVDGKPVYVFGGISGERVVAEVLRERRGYIAAQVVEVIEPSPDRVVAA
ncbi:MAG: SAM-dependent methyltransferase, partial [Chloroflexi bacterium]|nr:SAM-dependent methyltransferase [Chloroflexota bacterium]